jgi:two-component system chemotaxis sensor kinase CheA
MTPDRVRQLFAQEAEVRLAQLGQLLLHLEQTPDDEQSVRSIFREIHTIKGSAAVAGLDEVSGIAHRLEELIDEVRTGRGSITPEVIDTLLRGTDQLRTAIHQARIADPVKETAAPVAPIEVPQAQVSSSVSPLSSAAGGAGVVMVPLERLDELSRLVGETAAAHLHVGRMLNDRFDLEPSTSTEFNELSRSLNALQDRAMRAQMVPVSTINDQLQRAVRDLSRAQGKDIRWEARGTDTELDRSVLHQLSDSLLHLVRNAVDHGVETPAERQEAGKRPQATVRFRAMQLGSEVIITITDDGRGIDVDSVRRQAERQGIDTQALSESELLALTLQPGLSTTQFVTDVSGRGVGLDIVRTNVEAAHGRIEIRSELGAGTEFKLIVPITVAVLRCLLVEAGGQSFALPFHRVLLSQAQDLATVAYAEGRHLVWVNGHAVPVQALAETLGLIGGEAPTGPVVVLADSSRTHAFTVDRLIGQRDVVIKALNPILPRLPAVAGAGVEPDGSVLVVLDPPGLIERARLASRANGPATSIKSPDVHRRSFLVVDDALTIRELQRSILERAGFDVRVATDGNHALANLAEAPSDLVLTDVEMPNMDGFALTEAIRAHPTLANIPVLILSSRSSDADQQRGLDAGADGYITKSGFDETSLLTAVNRLLGTNA